MNFARPATGFILTEPATFNALLRDHAGKWPRILPYWTAIKDRLKMTGHKEGVAVGGNITNRVFEAEGDIASGLPTIRVAYHVMGDRMEFKMIAVLDPPG
jgi:hypothetical protein